MKPEYVESKPGPSSKCVNCGEWRDVIAITALCKMYKRDGKEFWKALKCKRGAPHSWS